MTPFDFVRLTAGVSAIADYWSQQPVFAPIRDPLKKRMLKRAGLLAHELTLVEAGGVQHPATAVKPLPVISTYLNTKQELAVLKWAIEGFDCRLCTGQWFAFAGYWIMTGRPPWRWGLRDLWTALAANGAHVAAYKMQPPKLKERN